MIDGLDLVIRQTLVAEIPSLATRLGFQPPDEAWRQRVGAGTGVWLNCALVDLREDRHRRSTEIRVERNPLRRTHPPYLMRCHYLLSAWNSAKDSAAVPATEQEHAAAGAGGRGAGGAGDRYAGDGAAARPSLRPCRPPGSEAAFDTDILPPEGFPKIAEFWGTMGRARPWRPGGLARRHRADRPRADQIDGVVTTLMTTLGRGQRPGGRPRPWSGVGGLVARRSGAHAASPVRSTRHSSSLADPAGRLRAARSPARTAGSSLDGLRARQLPGHRPRRRTSAPRPGGRHRAQPTQGPLQLQFT